MFSTKPQAWRDVSALYALASASILSSSSGCALGAWTIGFVGLMLAAILEIQIRSELREYDE